MQYDYRELDGVWDAARLLSLERDELSALAFEYEINGKISVCASLEYSYFSC